MKIVLIGMMGSGKSTVGRLLARQIGFPFIDTDHLIEAQTGKSIPTIFAEEGEAAFRRYENIVVDQLAALDRVVIACGGGTLLDRTNREKLRINSLWIYLNASVETLWKRLSHSSQAIAKRPLLQKGDPLKTLSMLIEERQQIYSQADLIITTGDQPAQAVVQTIVEKLPDSILRQPNGRSERWEAPIAATDDSNVKNRSDRPVNAGNTVEEVRVELGERSYSVYIGESLLERVGEMLAPLLPVPADGKRLAVIIGQPMPNRLYAQTLNQSLSKAGYETHVLEVVDGEQAKNLDVAAGLYDELVALRADRDTILLSLGGGVVCDLVGYVAATFMRGIPFVQVPTSLLAQVDASIGGKVAVNHPAGKNLIGSFYQPQAVFVDLRTLDSLPPAEFRNGMAEVIKYALLAGEKDFVLLEHEHEAINRREETALRTMIARCCRAKADVVSADETETGLRMILNLGHTFAHAFESLSGYKNLKHGEAVAIGCCLAAELSHRLGMIDGATVDRITRLFKLYSLPTRADGFDPESVYQRFFHDKKALGGKLRFVLMQGIGDIVIRDDVQASTLLQLLRENLSTGTSK